MKKYEKHDGGYMDEEIGGTYYEVAEVNLLLAEAVNLIQTLLPDSETGECQFCSAPISKGVAHRSDCQAAVLLDKLSNANG
jgi:hypothetical protein